ncbi:hypothetical protein [Campylobacter sp.]|uniref:hypothetical protein n=1 Tax=Campylobacter sp. TaxID=205 RepID=UPI002A557441|nr:hypothetical protein [Campylobacter sp.]MDD7091041.1 hypothetical protein [Campylobacteraceae bacterium]MDY5284637.1 hypothetical protein [Campylobacter sp.]
MSKGILAKTHLNRGEVVLIPPDMTLNIGSITKKQKIVFYILNSTFKPHIIDELPIHDKITITGAKNGDIIPPNEAIKLEIQLNTEEFGSIDEELAFTINGVKEKVFVKALFLPIFDFVPEFPIKQSLSFKTDVFTSQDGHESRANVLSKAKHEISFNIAARSKDELRRIDNLLAYAQIDKIYVPRWLELFKVKRYEDKALIFEYSQELFEYFTNCDRKNTLFLLWQSQDNYQIIKLKEQGHSVSDYSISTYVPVTAINNEKELSVEAQSQPYIKAEGALLIPLMLSQAEKKINLNYINESTAKFSLTFKEFNDVSNRL